MEKTIKAHKENNNLTIIIRIKGLVKVNSKIEDTLQRLRLRKKYAAVLINTENKNLLGMLKKVRYNVAYGRINKDILIKLLDERAKSIEGNKVELKIDSEKIAESILAGKSLEEVGLKPFFRLHPPRKGINSKLQYPKGVLGNNKDDINKLVERML